MGEELSGEIPGRGRITATGILTVLTLMLFANASLMTFLFWIFSQDVEKRHEATLTQLTAAREQCQDVFHQWQLYLLSQVPRHPLQLRPAPKHHSE